MEVVDNTLPPVQGTKWITIVLAITLLLTIVITLLDGTEGTEITTSFIPPLTFTPHEESEV